jgi:hypothetical protein
MAEYTFDFSDVDLETLRDGIYTAQVESFKMKFAENDRRYFVVGLCLYLDKGVKVRVYDTIHTSASALWYLKQFLKACLKTDVSGEFTFEDRDIIGKWIQVEIQDKRVRRYVS